MDKSLVEEIKLRLDTNRYELKRLDKFYLKAFAPKGYKCSTSYNDYDTIPSGNKEYRIEEFESERNKLIKAIEYDEEALYNALNTIDIDKYLSLLSSNKQRVDYLRNVKNYKLKDIESKLGLSKRYILKILKEYSKKAPKKSPLGHL